MAAPVIIPRIAAQTPFLQGVPTSFVTPEWYRVIAALTQVAASTASSGVSGPGSATNNALALFDGTSGQLIKNSGTTIDTDGTLAANVDTRLPTQKAVKTYVDTPRYSRLFLLMGG